MADITPTLDAGVRSVGDHYIISGTVVVPDTNANEFVVVPTTGSVIWCHLECTTDDATNDIRVVINQEDDFSTADNGTVAIQAEAADTFRFTAGVIPG